MLRNILIISIGLLILVGCEKNKNPMKPKPETTFKVRIDNISPAVMFSASGVFNTPLGKMTPSPAGPGEAFEFSFDAAPGSKLSFATMFAQSNDFFYAPSESGIALFDNNGSQVTGDVTAQIHLWDAGTEINQEPGVGMDQAPRQSGPNTGIADPDNSVRLAPDDFGNLPMASDVIKVMLTSTSATGFTVRIENVSDASTLQTSDGSTQLIPLSPGIWVIHTTDAPLFTSGQPDRGEGLEAIAEDGNPSAISGVIGMKAGIKQLISPGVWALHKKADVIFTEGEADRGEGLESLAEDGNPTALGVSLADKDNISASGVFNTPVGASQPGPAGPGSAFEFIITTSEDYYLSFAQMLGQTNDLFFAPNGMGIKLFEGSGMPITGDVTSQVMLWDAGTEVNEVPGVGLNQAPRQPAPNTGVDENGVVHLVNDGFSYPDVSEIIKVTIETE